MSILTKLFSNTSSNYCKNCSFAKDAFFDFFVRSQSQNEQYAKVVVSIGYVSYITILAMLKGILQHENVRNFYLTSILAISISLGIFVFYEIWKIKSTMQYEKELMKKLFRAIDNSSTFSLSDLKNDIISTYRKEYSHIISATKYIFNISVVLALISAICFFISVIILLLF